MSDTIYGTSSPSGSGNDNTTYCMGTDFSTSVDGSITTMRWYAPPVAPGSYNSNVSPVQVQLWNRDTSTIIASTAFGSLTLGAWNTTDFSSPVDITSGVNYCISLVTDWYTVSNGYFSSPITNGSLTAPANAGKFIELGSGIGVTYDPILPNSAFSSSAYFVDILFDADSGTSFFVYDGVDELPAGVSVWNGSTEDPMISFEISA